MRKKILKKLVAVVATTAMAFGMIATNSVNAAAAETVYLHGQFNNWGSGVALTSTDGVTYTGDVEVNANGNMCVLLTADNWQDCGTITSINEDASKVSTDGEGVWAHDQVWLEVGEELGTYVITYNKNTGAMTATIKTVSTTVWTYSYYIAGASAFEAEDWSNNKPDSYATKGKMTQSGTTWTYTATTTDAFDGSEGFNVIKIGTPDDDSEKTISWLKDGDKAFACDYKGAGTLTITFDETAGTCTVKFVASGNGNGAGAGSGAGAGAGETTPSTGDTSMVALYLVIAALGAVVVLNRKRVNE